LRSNNEGEYIFIEFKTYLVGKVIEHQLSIPKRSEQNGVAELKNWTLTKRVHSIRLQADMSEEF